MPPGCLESALQYAAMGLAVVPIRARDKRPLIDNWPECASSDKDVIGSWWREYPDANVGIATGQKSGVFVLDVDPQKGGDETYEDLLREHGQFPDTWVDTTGSGGHHFFFKLPNFSVKNSVGIFPGIDIRGDGGQVVAPPSIHPNGNQYEWDGLVTPCDGALLAPAPKWLVDRLKRSGNSITRIAEKVAEKLTTGKRNHTLTSIAGTLRNRGLEYPEILGSLKVFNQERCDPLLHGKELERIAKSVCRYDPGKIADPSVGEPPPDTRERPPMEPAGRRVLSERPACYDVEALMTDTSIVLPEMAIDGVLPAQGVILLGGRPKDCKTWLAVQMGCAFVTGAALGGWLKVLKTGRAHLWALEDQFSLTRDKLLKLYQGRPPDGIRDMKVFAELARPLLRGGAEIIQRELDESPAELVILDSLLKLSGERNPRADIVQGDYAIIDCARNLAMRNKCAVLIVMHTKKGSMGGDPINNLLGTTGNTAAADVLMELKKQGRNGKLAVRGRSLPSEDFELCWWDSDEWGWAIQGTNSTLIAGEVAQDIVAFLESEGGCRCKSMAAALHKSFGAVWQCLIRLQDKGAVTKDFTGKWSLTKR